MQNTIKASWIFMFWLTLICYTEMFRLLPSYATKFWLFLEKALMKASINSAMSAHVEKMELLFCSFKEDTFDQSERA